MPYTFTDWQHGTDPNGVPFTLDWTEAGMRGALPGVYLEALRQAAVGRYTALPCYIYPTAPAEVSPHLSIEGLRTLTTYIDAMAWHMGDSFDTAGWLIPADWKADYTGDYITPAVMSASTLLAALGDPARIRLPWTQTYPYSGPVHYSVGHINGAWLRQVQAIFKMKLYTTSSYGSGYSETDEYLRREGSGATHAAAAAAFNAASWITGWATGTWHSAFDESGLERVNRFSPRIRWRHAWSSWYRGLGLGDTNQAYLYTIGGAGYWHHGFGWFENNDFAMLDNKMCLYRGPVDLTNPANQYEWLGKIDVNTTSASRYGWRTRYVVVTGDWRTSPAFAGLADV